MKTRVIALALVLALMLPCFAMAAETEDIGDGYFRYTDTITLTVAKEDPVGTFWADPEDSTESNRMTRDILERFNVDVKTDWTSDDYYTKLSLMITAGDLPDVFIIDNAHYSMWAELVDNDMLMDMTDIIDTYASDFYKDILADYDNRPFGAVSRDGRIYGIPSGNVYFNDDNYLWIRQDWLDALGMEQPKTLEDLEKVLIAFRDNYNSKGLMLSKVSANYNNSLASFAAVYGAYLGVWVEGEDGKAVYGSLDQGVRQMLEVMHRWYEEGLINPEFMTSGSGANAAAFANGESGTLIGKWYGATEFTSIADVEGAVVSVCACPVDTNGMYTSLLPADLQNVVCVNKNCEHPEAVMEIFNYVIDRSGAAGEIIQQYDHEGTTWWAYYPFGLIQTTYAKSALNYCLFIEEYIQNNGDPAHIHYDGTESVVIPVAEQMMGHEVTDVDPYTLFWYKLCCYDALNLLRQDNVKLQGQAFSSTTESMADFWSNLQTLETTCFTSIIIGEQDISAFDEFVNTWYAEGGEMITNEVNELLGF